MKNKTKKLLDSLKSITKPKMKQVKYDVISNIYGEDDKGKPIYIDRIYGGLTEKIQLVNKNMTIYKGKIHKRYLAW